MLFIASTSRRRSAVPSAASIADTSSLEARSKGANVFRPFSVSVRSRRRPSSADASLASSPWEANALRIRLRYPASRPRSAASSPAVSFVRCASS